MKIYIEIINQKCFIVKVDIISSDIAWRSVSYSYGDGFALGNKISRNMPSVSPIKVLLKLKHKSC